MSKKGKGGNNGQGTAVESDLPLAPLGDELLADEAGEAQPVVGDEPVGGVESAVVEAADQEIPEGHSLESGEAPAEEVVETPIADAPAEVVDEQVAEVPPVLDPVDEEGAGDAPKSEGEEQPAPEGSEELPAEEDPVDEQAPEEAPEEVEEADDPAELPEQPVVSVKPSALREELRDKLPAGAVESWSNADLILYKETGKFPTLTKRKNLPDDQRRGRDLDKWTGAELEDWLEGLVKTPVGVEEDKIADEVYRRWKLPGNWHLIDAAAYVLQGVRPEYSEGGLLLNDRARQATKLPHWTYAEVRAALLGVIESPYTRDELGVELRKRMGLRDSFSLEKLLTDLDHTPTEVNMSNIVLRAKLDEFKVAMTQHGVNLSEETAGAAQKMLYKTIREVMQREPSEFVEGWVILLNWINQEYSTLFNPKKARFGWNRVALDKNSLDTFEDLLTLMIFSREPVQRRNIHSVFPPRSIENILRFVPSELERSNIIEFYGAPV